jgi:hypothetical protein
MTEALQISNPRGNQMKVAAYFNLHKHVFSLQSRSKDTYGRVIEHTDHVILKNPKFVVRQGGRQKVLEEKKKNVHAFVIGEVIQSLPEGRVVLSEQPVTYNPYRFSQFVTRGDERDIYEADYAILRLGVNGKPIMSSYVDHSEDYYETE